MGATWPTAGHSLAMASASSGVMVIMVPAPWLTPAMEAAAGKITRVLAPMLAMVRWMAMEAPLPISIMVITAATPMTMPRVVSTARMTLRRRAPKGRFQGASMISCLDEAVLNVDDSLGMLGHLGIVSHQDDGEAFRAVELLKHLEDILAGS